MSKQPTDYLLHSERLLLHDWGRSVSEMFNNESVYLVGSSITKKDYRDVDVRIVLDDKQFKKLEKMFNTEYLRIGVSLWGQKVTGLPIDFDVQPRSFANKKYKGKVKPISIKQSAIYNSIKLDRGTL